MLRLPAPRPTPDPAGVEVREVRDPDGLAVTWAATLADPEAPAVLVASDDGRPTYERMGYLALERWTGWLRRGVDAGPTG